MNITYLAYNLFGTGLFVPISPLFGLYALITGRHLRSIPQRLGLYSRRRASGLSGKPRIWIHAASVGEIRAAAAIIPPLLASMPECGLILSTVTDQGYELAHAGLGSKARCIYAPIDLYVPVRKAFSAFKPDIFVCIETELWPNMLAEAHRRGIKTALVNGRISDRSIKRYLWIRPLMRAALKTIQVFSMIGQADAHRIRQLGAPPDRVSVNGNAKFDVAINLQDMTVESKLRRRYDLARHAPVLVAGSTRGSEEEIILDVFEKTIKACPDLFLIIAPRHVNRSRHIEALVKARGFSCQLRSELNEREQTRRAPIVILDAMGELPETYSIASVVFCGGSLVPKGGQNILEPAAWAKPVIYGPSMEDFLDSKELLDQTGGGIQVADGDQLAERALYLLANPGKAAQVGAQALEAVRSNQGAAAKHAAAIHTLLTAG